MLPEREKLVTARSQSDNSQVENSFFTQHLEHDGKITEMALSARKVYMRSVVVEETVHVFNIVLFIIF